MNNHLGVLLPTCSSRRQRLPSAVRAGGYQRAQQAQSDVFTRADSAARVLVTDPHQRETRRPDLSRALLRSKQTP